MACSRENFTLLYFTYITYPYIYNVCAYPHTLYTNISTHIHFIHIHMHTYIRTLQTYVHTQIHTNVRTYTHVGASMNTHAYTHTHTHTQKESTCVYAKKIFDISVCMHNLCTTRSLLLFCRYRTAISTSQR